LQNVGRRFVLICYTRSSLQPETIKAVSFDAGGTLIEPWPSVGEVYAAVASEFGHTNISGQALNLQFAAAWKAKKAFDYSLSSWKRLVEAVFGTSVPSARMSELFEAIYQRFAEASAWSVYDDVRDTLQALRQKGYRLAVISNWDDRLRPLLSKLELSSCFEVVVLSVDVGASKPAAEIFQRTLTLLDLPAGSVLHVGDSLEEDVMGATQCGMQALLVDRAKRMGGSVASLAGILTQLPA
jgi:putative hydrolase of the HAD superfamily